MPNQDSNPHNAPDDFVRRHVHCEITSLVRTLARYASRLLIGQRAINLCIPVMDYETAATSAGWSRYWNDGQGDTVFRELRGVTYFQPNWESACLADALDPVERPVREHWLVSDWLADRLADHGERIDGDFGGLVVWGRTSAGQPIGADFIIRQLHNGH